MNRGCPFFASAVVLILAAVLIAVLAIILVVLVLAVVLVLILVLVVHDLFLQCLSYGLAATIACPDAQDLSLALKRKLAARPARMAAVIPPAEAFSPPVKIPRKPSC